MRKPPFLAVSALMFLAACPASAQPLTLADYWPHEDGRTWIYDQREQQLYPSALISDNVARMWFEGTAFAPGGPEVQVMKGAVTSLSAPGVLASMGVPAEVSNPLMRRLWVARPDLRAAIQRASLQAECPTEGVDGWVPLLLAPLAYRQTAAEVAAWRCNATNLRAWLWLTSDLSPGSTATLQLIPDFANDLFLHLSVFGLEDATVPGGTFQDCLRVDYVIDYGWTMCTDQSGNPLGTQRYETTGFVRYAPGVGPIECFEEFGVAEATGQCLEPVGVLARASLKLHEPSVPTAVSTWGRLKAEYRD